MQRLFNFKRCAGYASGIVNPHRMGRVGARGLIERLSQWQQKNASNINATGVHMLTGKMDLLCVCLGGVWGWYWMPTLPRKPCAHMGCGQLTIQGSNRCELHTKQKLKAADNKRERTDYHMYKTSRWQQLRTNQLHNEPLCAVCKQENRLTPATVADHITPHKGDYRLFHNASNLQSLCKQCHDRKTATEDGGFGRKL